MPAPSNAIRIIHFLILYRVEQFSCHLDGRQMLILPLGPRRLAGVTWASMFFRPAQRRATRRRDASAPRPSQSVLATLELNRFVLRRLLDADEAVLFNHSFALQFFLGCC